MINTEYNKKEFYKTVKLLFVYYFLFFINKLLDIVVREINAEGAELAVPRS